jgi:hypothetical protein
MTMIEKVKQIKEDADRQLEAIAKESADKLADGTLDTTDTSGAAAHKQLIRQSWYPTEFLTPDEKKQYDAEIKAITGKIFAE